MGDRLITVVVLNKTGEALILADKDLDHSKWVNIPEDMKEQDGKSLFKAQSRKLRGIEGSVTWKGGTSMGEYSINFKKPKTRKDSDFEVSVPDGYTYKVEGDAQGHHSDLEVTFLKK
jgi:hypothetical protein